MTQFLPFFSHSSHFAPILLPFFSHCLSSYFHYRLIYRIYVTNTRDNRARRDHEGPRPRPSSDSIWKQPMVKWTQFTGFWNEQRLLYLEYILVYISNTRDNMEQRSSDNLWNKLVSGAQMAEFTVVWKQIKPIFVRQPFGSNGCPLSVQGSLVRENKKTSVEWKRFTVVRN